MANIAKRALLASYDILSATIVAIIVTLALATPAFAYVDPSVMTYTIQALAGVAVALGAVAGVALRRTRRVVFKLLKIDENANKDVELDIHRVEPGSAPHEVVYKPKKGKRGSANGAFGLGARIGIAALTSAFAVVTAYLLPSFELISANSNDLTYSFGSIAPIIVAASLTFFVVIGLVLSLLRGKAFTIGCALVFAVGLCVYLQSMFLNGGLPAADGTEVDWSSFGLISALSLVIWIVLVVGAVVAALTTKGRFTRISSIVCAALVVIELFGVGSVVLGNTNADSSDAADPIYVTEDGMWDVSAQDNVIVFVLDMYDTRNLIRINSEHPDLLDEFEGFTWYQDSAGTMIPTAFAIPYMLTGISPDTDANIVDATYFRNRILNSTFLKDMKGAGYSVGIYSNTIGMGYLSAQEAAETYGTWTDNVHSITGATPDGIGATKILVKCALYRGLPWIAKPRFRYYTDDINNRMIPSGYSTDPAMTPYTTDDAAYYAELCNRGLTVNSSKGSFRFIHLNGAHAPYSMDENAQATTPTSDLTTNDSRDKQSIGSIHIVNTYLNYLKEMGLYKDATIIVTADHGDWGASLDLPTQTSSPILLYKAKGVDSGAVTVSTAQVSHDDLQPTILEALGLSWEGQYAGTTYANAPSSGRQRLFYQIAADGVDVPNLFLYQIDGNVIDFSNWHYLKTIPCRDYTKSYKEFTADTEEQSEE